MSRRASRFRTLARDNRGFTLAEVLLAALLVTIIGSIMALAMPTASRGLGLGARRSQAAALAQDQLESLRNGAAMTWPPNPPSGSDTPAAGFTRSWSAAAAGVGTLQRITVLVNWQEGTAPQQVRVVTLMDR